MVLLYRPYFEGEKRKMIYDENDKKIIVSIYNRFRFPILANNRKLAVQEFISNLCLCSQVKIDENGFNFNEKMIRILLNNYNKLKLSMGNQTDLSLQQKQLLSAKTLIYALTQSRRIYDLETMEGKEELSQELTEIQNITLGMESLLQTNEQILLGSQSRKTEDIDLYDYYEVYGEFLENFKYQLDFEFNRHNKDCDFEKVIEQLGRL